MRTGMLCMAIGIGAVAWLPRLPQPWLLPALAVPLLLAALRWPRRALLYPLALLAGVGWGVGYGWYICAGLLPVALEQETLRLDGHIDGLVEQRSGFQQRPVLRFSFGVEYCQRASRPCEAVPRLVQLSWYDASALPQPGERWQLRVQLKRPRGFANPGGFDYAAWLIGHRIGAVGQVERSGDNRLLREAQPWSIDAWRGRVRQRLAGRLEGMANRDLLLGLLVGDGSAIGVRRWEAFRDTGTVHLFVVSGLQIAFTGGLVLGCCRLWWRGPFAVSRRRSHLGGALPAALAALAYALLAGLGLPILRALIMFAIALGALVLRREVRAASAWLLALWLVLLVDPLAPLDAGFWFSFIVVGAMLLALCGRRAATAAAPRERLAQHARQWWRAQWASFIASLPVLLVVSGQVTPLALPANLLAIPWSTMVSIPLAFAALLADGVAPALGEWLWRCADGSLDWLWRFLLWLQRWGGAAIWRPADAGAVGLLCAAGLALCWLLPRPVPGRPLALLLLLPLLAPPLPRIAAGDLKVTVVDVGQGLGVLVETARHRLLYDTGPPFGPERATAELTLMPLLRARGARALDMVLVSHRDSDHSAGWPALERAFTVRRLLVGEDIGAAQAQPCRAGERWRWDGVDFEVLYPPPWTERAGGSRPSGNNVSCVLQVTAGDATLLLTGDIERSAEYALLDNPRLRHASILLAPHHGSRSSSTAALIERVQPNHVVFSAGYRNRFGHPAAVVEQRYRTAGAQSFNTATDGAIEFAIERGAVAQITKTRTQPRHYWE